jgi:hypothetical protein
VMLEELFDELPPRRQVDHAIEVMLRVTPPTKAPYDTLPSSLIYSNVTLS